MNSESQHQIQRLRNSWCLKMLVKIPTGKRTCKSSFLISKPWRTFLLNCLPRVRLLSDPQLSEEHVKGQEFTVLGWSRCRNPLVLGECGLSVLWLTQQTPQLSLENRESLPVWDRNIFVRGESVGWLVGYKLLVPGQWVVGHSKLQLVLRRDLRESSGFKLLFIG